MGTAASGFVLATSAFSAALSKSADKDLFNDSGGTLDNNLAKGARLSFSVGPSSGTRVLDDTTAADPVVLSFITALSGTGTTTRHTTDWAPHVFKLAAAATLAHPVNGLNAGDTIRVGDEFRRIVHYTGSFITGTAAILYQMTSGLQKRNGNWCKGIQTKRYDV